MATDMASPQNNTRTRTDNNELWKKFEKILYTQQTKNFPPGAQTSGDNKGKTKPEIEQEKTNHRKDQVARKVKKTTRKHEKVKEEDLLCETLTIWKEYTHRKTTSKQRRQLATLMKNIGKRRYGMEKIP